MKTYITISQIRPGSRIPDLNGSSISYDGAVAVPAVGDAVSYVVRGSAELIGGTVESRQFTYFDDELRVMLVVTPILPVART